MKKLYFLLLTVLITTASFGQTPIITAIVDGDCSGGTPKLLEIYALGTVDFSLYSIENQTNANTTWGSTQDLSTLGTVTDGFVYVTASSDFTFLTPNFPSIGSSPVLVSSTMNLNGDDRIRIIETATTTVIDQYGVENVDGSGQSWEYTDSYAKRNNTTGPDGGFIESNWTIAGAAALDNEGTCQSGNTFESIMGGIATFTYSGTPCAVNFGTENYICGSSTIGDNNDIVTIEIPYSGVDGTITSVTTTSTGTIGGDNPAITTDGTITISGLGEGDAWDVVFNGGNCDGNSYSGTVPADNCDPAPNTCFDLSAGTELFELVAVTTNSSGNNNGTWSETGGVYSANGYCGSGCAEPVESWLIFGPLDMTGVTDLSLAFDAAENFGVTDLNVAYTSAYAGCPTGSSWTTAQTITDAGSYEVDLSAAMGTDVFIGIQYMDDGADGYSGWDLSNVALEAFGACPTLGTRPNSNCAVCDLILGTENVVCLGSTTGAGNDMVTIEIPYTGVEGTITSLSTTSAGTIGGDDPTTVADGTITITGLGEGDAWDLTINGGDCDGTTISGTVFATNCDPSFLVINEILSDPDGTTGDANGDGTVDTSDDEFVELYNTGTTSIDLTDYVIADGNSDRHVFPAGTILAPNTFMTVFGAGTPTSISGMSMTASTGTLGLNNGGDTVTIKNAGGVTVAEYTYGSEAGSDQSIGRNPDFTGAFVQHTTITPADPAQFSPGLENDDPALSNATFTQTNNFSIYPNPVKAGYVNIKTTSNEAINVTVFDLLGKKVITKTLSNNKLNVSSLKSGVYLLNIEQNGASTTKKLVIE